MRLTTDRRVELAGTLLRFVEWWIVVQAIWELAPLLVTMLVLMACSAFFSASEAALFSLRASGAQSSEVGFQGPAAGVPTAGRSRPFAVGRSVLEPGGQHRLLCPGVAGRACGCSGIPARGNTLFVAFTVGSLLLIIFCSEMLPKTFAVLQAGMAFDVGQRPAVAGPANRRSAHAHAARSSILLSRRLIWPTFRPETYLQVNDLDRAIELSTSDSQLIDQERAVLRNLVALSDLRVDECMRPRSQLLMCRPPVAWSDIQQDYPRHGSLFVTERDSDEIVSVLDLNELYECPEKNLERYAERVLVRPLVCHRGRRAAIDGGQRSNGGCGRQRNGRNDRRRSALGYPGDGLYRNAPVAVNDC